MITNLPAFLGLAALLTITPGADMAVVTRRALARGLRAALLTSFGVTSGLLCWAVASAAGLAALLAASSTAFTVLKLIYSYLVTRAGDLLRRPAIRRWLERLTGTVLIGFGVRLASATR